MSSVEHTRIDTERNFLDVIDKVDEIDHTMVDTTHIFTLSQVYEGLLLNMGEKSKDAQTRFAYKTGATQVLFLQHVIDRLGPPSGDKPCGRCGLIID